MGKYDECYDATAERRPFSTPAWGPACQFDGECMVSDACNGMVCTHYTLYPTGPEVCNDSSPDWEAYDSLLCGCVRNRCAAFEL